MKEIEKMSEVFFSIFFFRFSFYLLANITVTYYNNERKFNHSSVSLS